MYFHPLNFIRFSLALGVILFHYGKNYFPFNHGFLNTLIINSSFRVSFFFFISGFVMCMVYGRSGNHLTAKHFYKRRFARVFPVYWLAFLWTLIVVVFIKKAAPKGLNILLHAVGLQSLNSGHVLDLNYPTWSISVELIFYLAFPFLLSWIIRFSVSKLVLVATLIWIIQSLQHIFFVHYVYNGTKVSEEFISTFPLWHFSTFFAGMATARFIALNPASGFFSRYSAFLLLSAILLFFYVIFIPNPVLKYVHNGLLSPLFALLILTLYFNKSNLVRVLSHPRISSLGDFSYGLFIFQYPVWVVCSKFTTADFAASTWFFLCYLLVLFITARIVNLYFEKPFLMKIRGEKAD